MNPAASVPPAFISEPALLRPFVLHPNSMKKAWRHQNPATGQWAVVMDDANVTHARMFSNLVFEPCLLYQGLYVNNHELFWWVLPEETLEKDPALTQVVEMAKQHILVHVEAQRYVRPIVVSTDLVQPPDDIRNN